MDNGAFWIAAWGLVASLAAALAGFLASIKNRDYSFWIGWTFILPPLVLILALLPRLSGPRPKRPSFDEDDKNLY